MGADSALPWLRVSGATAHNLRDLSVAVPLRRLVCLTGVSGSGKTTLLREVLLPALEREMAARSPVPAVAPREPEETGEAPAVSATVPPSQPGKQILCSSAFLLLL